MSLGSSLSSGSYRAPTPGSLSHGTLMTRGAGGKFQQILEHFLDLKTQEPAWGYYPDPTKSILVMAPGNVAREEEHFRGLGIRVMMGHHYLGGYIRDRESEGSWLEPNIKEWTKSVAFLARVSQKYPQSPYAGLQKSLQQEWEFVQRVTPGVGDSFRPVEKALKETFVPELFEGLQEEMPERGVTRLPVKQAGLALLGPSQTIPEN